MPERSRSLLAGSDTPPPERVPLGEHDFVSQEEQARVMAPWRVTDGQGRVLPRWLSAQAVFERERRLVPA